MNKEFMKTVWVVLTRYYMGKTIIPGPLNETEESIHNQVLRVLPPAQEYLDIRISSINMYQCGHRIEG